ncbi:MAG: ABC transporter ATP-binding protein [Clostridiales bacterium]|nr:ABC transporter ATP-binding protein [Clostridiales bacterium]
MNPSFEASDICWSYGNKTILDHAALQLFPGECVGVVGINGSGKSTLLSILAGIKKVRGGNIRCYGHDLSENPRLYRKLTGYVPQENPLLEELSVKDNLRIWSNTPEGLDPALLESLGIDSYLNLKVRELSGGMKRRVSLAAALINNPPVLIMDEPSSALDLHHREVIQNYLREYTNRNGTVIMSTHDIEEIKRCTRILYIEGCHLLSKDASSAIKDLREELL